MKPHPSLVPSLVSPPVLSPGPSSDAKRVCFAMRGERRGDESDPHGVSSPDDSRGIDDGHVDSSFRS